MTQMIPANDHGKVYVFQLAYPLKAEVGQIADYARLEAAIGAKITNPADVQIVSEDALHDLGLAQFLMMGHGISETAIAPKRKMLNALKGSFAIVRSGAFGGAAVTLSDTNDAKLIATFTERTASAASLIPLTSDGTQGILTPQTKAPKSDARIGGMIATIVLILLGLLVWLMIWIGG